MALKHLLDEIWILIALELTIDGILATERTCRRLHNLLSKSLTLWRAVIRDLLSFSPNISLSHSLDVETVNVLRRKALRFVRLSHTLSGTASTPSVRSLDLPIDAAINTVVILSGTGFAAYLSRSGLLHVVSLKTGQEMCIRALVKHDHAEVRLCSSKRYGPVVAVYLVTTRSPYTQEIWLFQLNAAVGEISFLWHHAHQLTMADFLESKFDFKDDTLAIFWHARTPPEMDVIDVPSAIAGKSGCLKFQRRLEWRVGGLSAIALLAPDHYALRFARPRARVEVFRLPNAEEVSPASPTELQLLPDSHSVFKATLSIPGYILDIHKEGRDQRLDPATYDDSEMPIEVSTQVQVLMYMLLCSLRRHISPQVTCRLMDREEPREEQSRASIWTRELVDVQIQLSQRDITAKPEAARRLATHGVRVFSFPLEETEVCPGRVMFDEWSGTGIVPVYSQDGHDDRDRLIIFTL